MANVTTPSEKIAAEHQKKFMRDAIAFFGSDHALARRLCVTVQSIDNWKQGANLMSIARMVRISEIMGVKSIHVEWN